MTGATVSKARATVVIADDHSMTRAGVRALLEGEEGFEVVGEAQDVVGVLSAVRQLHPDLALVDLHMPGGPGVDMVARIGGESPGTRIVILTMEADPAFASRALRAGASGYVLKESAPYVLLEALRLVLHGDVYLEPSVGARMGRLQSSDPLEQLSDRERQVLAGVAIGKTNRDLADELFLSIRTVETHRANVQRKLGISGAVALNAFARRHGLIE